MLHDNSFFTTAETYDFSTLSAPEGRQYIRRSSFGNELRSWSKVKHFYFAHSRLRLGQVTIDLARLNCGSSFEVIQVEPADVYTFKIPLEGFAQYSVDGERHIAVAGHLFATNPVEIVRKRFVGPYSQIIATVTREKLEAVLCKELARPLREPLEFDLRPQMGVSSDAFALLVKLLWLDLRQLGAHAHPRLAAHLEYSLLVAALTSIPNNYSGDLNHAQEQIAPFYVRKAESFIHGHLDEQIAIGDIVEASGASSRSLYYGFKRWRQTTPMAYLKAARLERAHAELAQASHTGGVTVTDVAFRVGYHHLNHFSCDYKARFGERPSDTLRGR